MRQENFETKLSKLYNKAKYYCDSIVLNSFISNCDANIRCRKRTTEIFVNNLFKVLGR